MRSEKVIYNKIIEVAKNNNLIKAVYMNGSRTNPKAEKDILRDYDLVYVVADIEPFVSDISWLKSFGDIAIIQDPNMNDIAFGCQNYEIVNRYNWLVLYKDHTRIDITIQTIEYAQKEVVNDSLTAVLLDKDGIFPELAESSDKDYYVQKPTKEQYNACVNNFWWCLQNVAKGLRRKQIPYAMKMYNIVVRDMLDRMVNWHIGCEHNFSVSAGSWGKYYNKLLGIELYELYEKSYSDCNIENIWNSIDNASKLFNIAAVKVARSLGYNYNQSEEDSILMYISFVKETKDIMTR